MANLWIAAKWLGLEYTHARQSIEWAYLTLARYIAQHGFETIYGNAEWFPYWYNGVPFENTYPPLLHYAVAIISKLGQVSAGRAYHLTTGFLFALAPVGVYLLALRWTRSILSSLTAAVFYSLLSPCAWLMPSIAGDLNSLWLSQRLNVLATWGEGPHLTSVALLPFAMLALDWALEQFTWRRAAVAAILCAMVPLSNIIGGAALAWGALAVVAGRNWRGAHHALAIGLWAYLLASRWLNPTNLADIQRNAQFVGGPYIMNSWHYLALAGLAIATIGLTYALRKWPSFALPAAFTFPMLVIPLSWEFVQYFFLPQPSRYHIEMDLGLALLLASVLANFPKASWPALAMLAIFGALHGQDFNQFIQPMKLEETFEHRITRFMANYDGNSRVYFQGTPRFFAGVEYDQVQFGGGFANGIRWPLFFLADYGITAYKGDGRLTASWLKAYGVDYVAVGDATTEDPYKPWQDPHQFRGLLTEVWRERGDAIYELNRANESLAHVIPRAALVQHAPRSYLERDELDRYVDALEGPQSNGGSLDWLTPSHARIEATTATGDAISIQIAHDPRWRATANGKQLPLHPDALGQLWIEPGAPGPVTIDLEFHQSKLILLFCGVSWLVALGALASFQIKRTPSS